MDGALLAIRFAREHQVPFLGTCGGFQHAVVEFARNVMGQQDAEHAETAADANNQVITPLVCALVEQTGRLTLIEGYRLHRAYGSGFTQEGYHCSYGLNEAMRDQLASHGLQVAAVDDGGDVRALELDGHPFFVLTLFQPERAALNDETPPIVQALLAAAMQRRQQHQTV
jgi:CTP synthase (UTP-ammonia lyase)